MDKCCLLLLDVLRAALEDRGLSGEVPREELAGLYRLACSHNVLPLVTEVLWKTGAVDEKEMKRFLHGARKAVAAQAQRTASLMLLYSQLQKKGLAPVIMKGFVCRALYPVPEQRPSVDEDFLISPEEFGAVDKAFKELGLMPETTEKSNGIPEETAYLGSDGGLEIELHTVFFSKDNPAYAELNDLFDGAMSRTIRIEIGDVSVRTLAPTDHMLYLLCHAYKHFLHAGVGIRQVCDICLMAESYKDKIDWEQLYDKCFSVRIHRFSAALFRIGEKYLGFISPEVFDGDDGNEAALLEDIMTGGLYGVSDIDRAHSGTITIEAVASHRQGRRNKGVWSSLFPGRNYMEMKYSYLKEHHWLLPFSWAQRVVEYLSSRDKNHKSDPGNSLKIANQRVELLREYGIID